MYAVYGSYAHDQNEVSIRSFTTNEATFGEGGQITAVKKRLALAGRLHAATPSLLTTAMRALESAYAQNGYDWTLYESGGTPTQHRLTSADAYGGVKVLRGPVWTDGPGEYTTYRSYEIELEAEYRISGVNFSRWQESLSFEGDGGPIYRYIQTINGSWQKQQISERSTYRATQQGTIVGIFAEPNYPAPLWPDAMHREQSRVTRDGPSFDGTRYSNFGVSWSYVFESNQPLSGTPNRQPG